ncbi:MAG: ndh [Cyanobacteria bacterium RYN_339]|nr:ndh [Cyanobacteria bacterium RYN_339]
MQVTFEKDDHDKRKRVVIVGAGFGGLSAAKQLGNQPGVEVVLIDRRNYHLFQPLLYQVATAALSPADIAVPIRGEMARYANVEVHLGQVEQLDLANRLVGTPDGGIRYDYLVLACGAKHSYFGKPEWEPFAPGLKTLEQATELRFRILSAFERAETTLDPVEREACLTFVVVGGGPTGAELAGALAEIARNVLVRDFRRIDPRDTHIVLVEAGKRVLSMFSEDLSQRALEDLADLGVDVRLQERVVEVDAAGVQVGDRRIAARTVIWAAGVQPSGLNQHLGVELDRAGRAIVQPDLSLQAAPNVFVIGDQAHAEQDGKPLPGLAPVALQQGKAVARNILRELAGKPREPFKYFDKGQMATIGKQRAVAETGKLKLTGLLAWLAWLFIHIMFLVNFRNRLAVTSQWVWSYAFGKRNARLIIPKTWRSYGDHGEI